MTVDHNTRNDRALPETTPAVRERIASVRPGDRVVVTASRYRCLLPGHSWSGRIMVWPEKPPRGQLATVQAVDGYSTLLDGVTTDIVLLTTLGVLHGGGSRTVWKLQDNAPAARTDDEPAGRGTSKPPAARDVRAWARRAGLDVEVRGRLRGDIQQAWRDAHPH